MSDELKRQLYEYFLKDTPLEYESVTDEQWQQLVNTSAGRHIAVVLAFKPIKEALIEAYSKVKRVLTQLINGINKGGR